MEIVTERVKLFKRIKLSDENGMFGWKNCSSSVLALILMVEPRTEGSFKMEHNSETQARTTKG